MIVDVSKKILIVGLGLLGGSYAEALKRYGFHVSAVTRSQSSVDYALEKGIIDEGAVTPDERIIGEADIVIFSLYPHIFIEWIEKNQKYFKSGAILTDVTGVKRSVVYKIQSVLRDDVEFIAAHPMAGREVYGVQNSTSKMFAGANYVITPTDKNTPEAIEVCRELGCLLGFANIAFLTPEEHDEMIGFVSQLTHVIAVTLMTCSDHEHIEKFTGDSFRDLTRIARINEDMWSELFIANKDALLRQMDMFSDKFAQFRKMIESDDTESMKELMRASTKEREKFDVR